MNHGFICSWMLGLSYLAIVPLNATALALVGRNLLHKLFQAGFHYTAAGYDVYLGEIILAEAALILFGLLSIKGVKLTGIFQTLIVFALVAGVAVVLFAAILSPDVSASNLKPQFSPNGSKLSGVLSVAAVAPWAFVGFDTIPQASEEFNFSAKKTKIIMVISICFGAFVYIALNTVTAAVIPDGYSAWTDYLSDLKNLSGIMALPTFHAAWQLLGGFGTAILGIAVTCAILSGIIGFYMAASRLLYSMSRDKILPSWFGALSSSSTPKNAIFFIMLISMIAPFFGRTALGWVVDMSSLGAAVGYGYTSLAALKFAAKEKRRGIIFTGILGTIFSLVFCLLLLLPIPSLGISLGKESLICLLIWILAGAVFFITSKRNTPGNDVIKNESGRCCQ
ncbi:MAG: APC family permease [Eubacterium sp.]